MPDNKQSSGRLTAELEVTDCASMPVTRLSSCVRRLISNSFQRTSRALPNGFGYGIDPGSDGVPIAEVAFAGASGLHGHSIPAIELAVVQGAVEYGVMTLADLFAEPGELERLLLVIFHFGGERANAEEPCGNVG